MRHVKHTGKKKIAYRISVGEPETYLNVLGVDGRKILKCI